MPNAWTRRTLLSAAGASAMAGRTVAAPASVITVPMRLSFDRLLIDVWLDGRGPVPFTLDTGSASYMIDPVIARAVKLPETVRAGGSSGVSGKVYRPKDFLARQVVIGGALKSENVVLEALNSGGLGLIPLQLLMLKPTVIDPAEGELRIFETGAPDVSGFDPVPLMTADTWTNGIVVSDGVERNPKLVVDVKLDGRPFRVGIDTGAGGGGLTLFASTVEKHGLWDHYAKHIESNGVGVFEAFKGRMVRAQTLQFGATVMKDPTVELIHSGGETPPGFDGLLGMDALRRFSLALDWGNHRLWVKANGATDQAFRYNRSGIVNGVVQGRAEIVDIIPDSPAGRAGLQVGDRLLHPQGETFSDLMWRLSDAPGTVVEIEVDRAGQRLPARLVLAELI